MQTFRLCNKKIFLDKFDLINDFLTEYNTSISTDMLESLPVNDLWINFKQILSTTMEKLIPTQMISPNTNMPWSRHTHKGAARHRRRSYYKAKSTNAPTDFEVHMKLKRSLDHSIWKHRSDKLKAIGDNLKAIGDK